MQFLGILSALIGVLAGFLMAKFIPDETGWYQKYFFGFSIVGLIVVAALSLWPFTLLGFAAFIFVLGAMYALREQLAWLFFACIMASFLFGVPDLAIVISGILLVPATGYLYSNGLRRELLYSLLLLVPILITGISLL